ncbi:uncharacterized protein LOC130810426 isoform X2 [Amaranthus tricolor]|uniref:uncharacterized protein LOC130810426 isoform X2 n=1 Tax=Amaranthus tricolor TaxID=29722 RepID=UPI0025865BEB|nr:uncharacterized protein LOC130810426 isoform X2 [Amaranthus tricolor]
MKDKKQKLMKKGLSLAEALYEYGKGNDEAALQKLGSDFDACDYKVIGASDEQIDVFNEVWYSLLLNTGKAAKVIEVIERRVETRDGVPFLWRLLALDGANEEEEYIGALFAISTTSNVLI